MAISKSTWFVAVVLFSFALLEALSIDDQDFDAADPYYFSQPGPHSVLYPHSYRYGKGFGKQANHSALDATYNSKGVPEEEHSHQDPNSRKGRQDPYEHVSPLENEVSYGMRRTIKKAPLKDK